MGRALQHLRSVHAVAMNTHDASDLQAVSEGIDGTCVVLNHASCADAKSNISDMARAACAIPALILWDLRQCGSHEAEFMPWIRSNPQTRHTPVVVIASERLLRHDQSVFGLGCNAVVVLGPERERARCALERALTFWLGVNVSAPTSIPSGPPQESVEQLTRIAGCGRQKHIAR